ncbi:hypothetical protein [Leifsonia sp. RAF41]|uniref:hypothetical protein n=1 Tax=Leifsonia sp. RAF41 TaxID=3233056 RepID=UPI003F9BF55C
MITDAATRAVAADLERQSARWLAAASTFLDAEEFASEPAWRSVELYIGMPLRRHLKLIVDELIDIARATVALTRAARRDALAIPEAMRAVQNLRRRYSQVETTLDFFGDAVSTRTSPQLRATLQSLDALAAAGMEAVLGQAGHPPIPVLTYIDKGMGASILRADIRLWAPGSINPVAAIKVVRFHAYLPTSLFHEVGHQVAAVTGWVPALQASLGRVLAPDPELRTMWLPWASEIAADVFAFCHTGYASVAALYDVVGDARTILRWPIGDPHPVGWLRTLLGCALCRGVYGRGPWDDLEAAVVTAFPLRRADPTVRALLDRSRRRMPAIAAACLATAVPGLAGRPITTAVDPRRVAPAALAELERSAGPALWTSPHWRRTEGIRIVALTGLREAERPDEASAWIARARDWMTATPMAA